MVLCGNLILSEVVLIFYSKIIKAGEILRQVKFHRLFHFRDGFCPNLLLLQTIVPRFLLPLNRCRRFARDVVDDAVDVRNFVHDAS